MNVLNVNDKHVSRLGSLDLEGPGKIVDLGQVDVANIVCRIVVLDLAARPIDTLNLYSLSVLDCPGERNCCASAVDRRDRVREISYTVRVPSVLREISSCMYECN